jgi:hypothetical protein
MAAVRTVAVAAASVVAVGVVPLHRVVLRRPCRRHRTLQGLSTVAHLRRRGAFRHRRLQRRHLTAASSSVSAALEHRQKELGSSPT